MKKHIVIIGAGPGGYVAALRAAQLGAEVTLIEKNEVGGVCLNEGCIPTKALNKNAEIIGQIERASEFGINVQGYEIDFGKIMERKDQVVKRLRAGVMGLLKRAKVEVVKGTAYIEAADKVLVSLDDGTKKTVTCNDLIVATGSHPFMPRIEGINYAVTSREILDLKELPASMVIMGGGVIGVELAGIFRRFGVEITVLEMQEHILPSVDEDIAAELTKELKKSGVEIHTSCAVERIEKEEAGYLVYAGGNVFRAELAVNAIGRKATLPQGKLSFTCERGAIVTDEYMRTSIPHVYCIGDANGKYQLAHVASAEALAAVGHIMGENRKMSYHVVPSVIYSFPEVACVGVGEKEACGCKKGTFPYAACGKAVAMGETSGFAKIIAEPHYQEIVGAQIVGYDAATLIGELGMAMQLEATVQEVDTMIHAHPSLSEILMEACEDVDGVSIHK